MDRRQLLALPAPNSRQVPTFTSRTPNPAGALALLALLAFLLPSTLACATQSLTAAAAPACRVLGLGGAFLSVEDGVTICLDIAKVRSFFTKNEVERPSIGHMPALSL